MKDNKGQALVEFVIILPILLLIIISMIDFGNIILKKYHLEEDLNNVVVLYDKDKNDEITNYINYNKLNINYEKDNDFVKIIISKDVNIISPVLNVILGKSYKINTSRVIYDE